MSHRKYKIKFRWYGGWFIPSKKQKRRIDDIVESWPWYMTNETCELFEQGKAIAMFESVFGFDCWLKLV